MPRQDLQPLVIDDLRGGRNDTDPPMQLPANQAVEMLNVDWKDATLGHKRGGSATVAITGGTAFSSGMQTLIRHVPGADETAAELWGIDGAPIAKRLTAGTSFANVTLDDAISTKPQEVVGASLNGKLFLAYDSSVDRLHVYDPNLSSPRVRRVSFATPAAPTLANFSSGSYPAVKQYVRVRWLQLSGTLIIRRSEPSPSANITPSGSGAGITVTRPTAAGEGETHWEIEVSADDATWYMLFAQHASVLVAAPIAIASTTQDYGTTIAQFTTVPISEPVGMFSRFPSVKYLLSDGNRLLGAGAWETAGADSGGKSSRVWFTPVLGSTDHGDDERISNQTNQKNWVDLNENDGGGITALGGPVSGIPFAFKYRQTWKVTPTGDVTTPYLPRKLRDDVGCISHKSLAIGEDHAGRPSLYFMSHRGPYRIVTENGAAIIQYLGRDNEVTWRSMNLGATTVVSHSLYYPELHQWWVWIATGTANDPDVKMMFDVQRGFPDENGQIRGGWAKHDGLSAGARCSCLFSNTLGASMSRDLKPYVGRSTGTTVLKCDTADLDDAGTAFQARIKSRPLGTAVELGFKHGLEEPYLLAKAGTATITLTTDRDFGKETRTHQVSLAAETTETRVTRKFDGAGIGEADTIQVELGDIAAQTGAWTLDALIIPRTQQERH